MVLCRPAISLTGCLICDRPPLIIKAYTVLAKKDRFRAVFLLPQFPATDSKLPNTKKDALLRYCKDLPVHIYNSYQYMKLCALL